MKKSLWESFWDSFLGRLIVEYQAAVIGGCVTFVIVYLLCAYVM